MNKIRVGSLFSGIGAFEFALKRMNLSHEIVFACDNGERIVDYNCEKEFAYVKSLRNEKEKKDYVDSLYKKLTRRTNFVENSYLANYKIKDDLFFQDIRLLDGRDFENKIDILVGGSPCQSFSSVGYQRGLEDARGTLFYDFARLVNETKPKVFIYENVRNLLKHDCGKTWQIIKGIFESLGYHYYYQILDAEDYGIPQKRRRLFVVGFKNEVNFNFPQKIDLQRSLKDFAIETNDFGSISYGKNGELKFANKPGLIDSKYYLSPKLYAYVMKGGTKSFYQKPVINLEIGRPLLSTMGNRHRAGIDNYLSIDGNVRMLSEREALRLMGFTDDYKQVVSRAQTYKQAGNSIVVDVLMAIIKEILKTKSI